MKFFRVVASFVSIYLFLFSILTLIVGMFWLKQYVSDSGNKKFAEVTISSFGEAGAMYSYVERQMGNALLDVLRARRQSEQGAVKFENIKTSTVFLEFREGTVDSSLFPFGVKKLYKLERVTTGEGLPVYTARASAVFSLLESLFDSKIQWKKEIIPIVAGSTSKTYTLVALTEGIKAYEN